MRYYQSPTGHPAITTGVIGVTEIRPEDYRLTLAIGQAEEDTEKANPPGGGEAMTVTYQGFIKGKEHYIPDSGKSVDKGMVHPKLFEWQQDITVWAIRKGRCSIFLDTGLGKTFIQMEWARLLGEKTLIIAPLSVARQTIREGRKIGIEAPYVRRQSEIPSGQQIAVTNYEMVDNFDLTQFGAVVLDESSILKNIAGKTRKRLTALCKDVPYKLCCTATPAPNDYIELGNHAEFLGVCSMQEMLATFFVNANKEHILLFDDILYRKKGANKGGTEWRLKHHAEQPFFKWLSSWALSLTLPSDLGYADDGFILPPLNIYPTFVDSGYKPTDQLFFTSLKGISDRANVRRLTLAAKAEALKSIMADIEGQSIVWCGLDAESKAASAVISDSIEVKGSDSLNYKVDTIEKFQDGDIKVMVTKPSIAGFGMNFQQAHNMVFFGLNDSWESYYQAIRREWRYGQQNPVNVYIILDQSESEIYANVQRKDALAKRLRASMIDHIRTYEQEGLGLKEASTESYETVDKQGDGWVALLGDSCERLSELPDESIDLTVYSPPFADLFTYTNSPRDLGNSKGWGEFLEHYAFIVRDLLRLTKSGRLSCVHTSDIPAMAQRDGYIGVRDFPGEIIKLHEREGWVFVGRVFVQKNPQAQAIRVKSKALLFVQLRKDSSDSRPALVDQILLFRKSGDNTVPVRPVENGELDNETWIEWAHGIWLGIQETNTLQFSKARGADDEKHICPLQLGVIERCIKLYSNPGETVLSPFGGIGSEGYMALKLGRKAIIVELKPEYFQVAVSNLQKAETMIGRDMFQNAGAQL